MAKAGERTQKRHVREKATIDHLARDVYEPKAAGEEHTAGSPRPRPACRSRIRFARDGIPARVGFPFFGAGMTNLSRLRKRPLEADAKANARAAGEIDIAGCATIAYSSEQPNHPVEHLLDGNTGPEPRAGSVRAPIPSSISWWSLIGSRRSRGSSTKSRRRSASTPRKCAWRSRRTEAARAAKSWLSALFKRMPWKFRERTAASRAW